MRAARRMAQTLVESGGSAPPQILAGFAKHYLEMADHDQRARESVALFAEARAHAHRDHMAGSEEVSLALRVIAQDVRAGLDTLPEPPSHRVHVHADGGLYVFLGTCAVKDDETGEWNEGVAYRALEAPASGTLCVTSLQRWDDRFTPVDDPTL